MRARFLIAIGCAAACIGIGAGSAHAYPPSPRTVSATPSVGGPAYTVKVIADCTPGELVTFKLGASEANDWCATSDSQALVRPAAGIGGSASAELTAPMTTGDFRGTAAGSRSEELGSFTISVIDVAPARQTVVSGTIQHDPFKRVIWIVVVAMSVALAVVAANVLGFRYRYVSRR